MKSRVGSRPAQPLASWQALRLGIAALWAVGSGNSFLLLGALVLGICLASAIPALAKDTLYMGGINKIVVVDGDSDEVTGEITIKGWPVYLVPDRENRRLYVVAGRRELIFVIDLDKKTVVDTLSFSVPGQKRAHIYGLAVDAPANRLYAAIQPTVFQLEDVTYEAPYIAVVDLGSKKIKTRVKIPTGVSYLALGTGEKKNLLAIGHDLYHIDLQTLRITETTPLVHPALPGRGNSVFIAEWFHPESCGGLGAIVYGTFDPITNLEQTGVLLIDTATGDVNFIDIGPPPRIAYHFSAVVSPDRKQAYMSFNNVAFVDLERRRVTDILEVSESYYVINLSSDGQKIYAAGGGSSFIVIDAASHKILKRVLIPADVWDFIVVPGAAAAPTGR